MIKVFSLHLLALSLALVCGSNAYAAASAPADGVSKPPPKLDEVICGLNNHADGRAAMLVVDSVSGTGGESQSEAHVPFLGERPVNPESKICPLGKSAHLGMGFGGHGCCLKEQGPASNGIDISFGAGGSDFILASSILQMGDTNVLLANAHATDLYVAAVLSLELPPPRA